MADLLMTKTIPIVRLADTRQYLNGMKTTDSYVILIGGCGWHEFFVRGCYNNLRYVIVRQQAEIWEYYQAKKGLVCSMTEHIWVNIDPDTRGILGHPLNVSRTQKHNEVYLKECNVNTSDIYGWLPLSICSKDTIGAIIFYRTYSSEIFNNLCNNPTRQSQSPFPQQPKIIKQGTFPRGGSNRGLNNRWEGFVRHGGVCESIIYGSYWTSLVSHD